VLEITADKGHFPDKITICQDIFTFVWKNCPDETNLANSKPKAKATEIIDLKPIIQ